MAETIIAPTELSDEQMRAEFEAWVQDCGCDTDGAWSAWCAAWNRRADDLRDAARYRWLRDTGYWFTSPGGSPWAVIGTGAGDATPACGQQLDAAVDAGIEAMPAVAHAPSSLPGVQAMTEATTDQLIELAGALEQRRALAIVEGVRAIRSGLIDGPFSDGFESACEEITQRLRTEVWDGCLPPVDAPKDGGREAICPRCKLPQAECDAQRDMPDPEPF